MKKWICLALILAVVGGSDIVNLGDKKDDHGKDWWIIVENIEEGYNC